MIENDFRSSDRVKEVHDLKGKVTVVVITLFADRMYTHTDLSREDKVLYQYTVQESTDEYGEAFVSSCTFPLLSYFHRSPCR